MTFMLFISPSKGLAQSPHGEDVVEVIVEKGGKLENAIKKANALGAKKVFINGSSEKRIELNEKDMKFLLGMNQLEELYLNVATEGAVGYKYNALSGKSSQADLKLTNSRFPNLKIIGIGKAANGSFYGLFDLTVQGMVLDGYTGSFPEGIIFEDLYLSSEPESYQHDGFQGFLKYHEKGIELGADGSNDARRKIHSIHAGSPDWLNSEMALHLDPAVVYIQDGSLAGKYLANYQSKLYEEDKDANQYDVILPAALYNSSFENLRLPDKQESISDKFLNNVSVTNLDLNNIKRIGENAFYGSHIKEIHIPPTVKDIDEKGFYNSEIKVIYMDGEYAPAINANYVPEGFENIQFMIPKGSKENYNIGIWKKLRVLEDGASTDFTFDFKEPGTLASLLTDDIKKSVVSLKLRGVLFSDDIKLLEDCPNLSYLDLAETFIAQSPKELREKQETSDYLAGVFMNMGIISQSEFEHDRMSTMDNLQVQYLAKLGEMAKNQTIESDPNCQIPRLDNTRIVELIFPLQLQKVFGYALPRDVKKITLPPDLKEFSIYPIKTLTEIILPSSVQSIEIMDSNHGYDNLQSIDMSACENPSISIEGKFEKLQTVKLPESYTSMKVNLRNSLPVNFYFKGREQNGYFYSYKSDESNIYIPKGSRAGYSNLINNGYNVIEQ